MINKNADILTTLEITLSLFYNKTITESQYFYLHKYELL